MKNDLNHIFKEEESNNSKISQTRDTSLNGFRKFKHWSIEDEDLLMDYWIKNFKSYMNDKKLKFYNEIMVNLFDFKYDYIQIKNKINKNRIKYLDLKKLNDINLIKNWKYFYDLDKIYSNYPDILSSSILTHKFTIKSASYLEEELFSWHNTKINKENVYMTSSSKNSYEESIKTQSEISDKHDIEYIIN